MIGIVHQSKHALAVVTLVSSVAVAIAQETTKPDRARPAQRTATLCAEHHLRLVTLIDALGEVPQFGGDRLFKTLLAIADAHHVCVAGHEDKALSLYDRAVLDLVFPAGSLR
jgi:hypothetical protein